MASRLRQRMVDKASKQRYLNALGIETWRLRGAHTVQVSLDKSDTVTESAAANVKVKSHQIVQTDVVLMSEGMPMVEPLSKSLGDSQSINTQTISAEVMAISPISIAQAIGGEKAPIVIVLDANSTWDDAVSAQLNAMLNATQWSPQQCVLLRLPVFDVPSDATQFKSTLSVWLAAHTRHVLLLMGQGASQTLLNHPLSNTPLEQVQTLALHDIPCIATYHPADSLANPALKRPIWEDLKRAMALL